MSRSSKIELKIPHGDPTRDPFSFKRRKEKMAIEQHLKEVILPAALSKRFQSKIHLSSGKKLAAAEKEDGPKEDPALQEAKDIAR
jgi:hypothetical protein